MGVDLTKGGRVSLTKEAPGLTQLGVGLGWDPRNTDGAAFDLDASAFLLNANGKVNSDSGFVFFNNKTSSCGSVVYSGDNLTGEGDGDDETINIDFTKVPEEVQTIAIAVSIHEADTRNQNFGQVGNCFIRAYNSADETEIAKYDLEEDYSNEKAMVFGEFYRKDGEWRFKAVGSGYADGLTAMTATYGVNVG